MPDDDLPAELIEWYDRNARRLPWREPDVPAWGVLVSEIMLQQTPVARVRPVYDAWMQRWPTPAHLAAEPAGEAVRMWDKLGYPRRALRLHACAQRLVDDYAGEVPADVHQLLLLPGIGDYTARAIAAFAFGQRVPVVDTNVRRVQARLVLGQCAAGPPSTARDLAEVQALLPDDPGDSARFSIALMELGALICTARAPKCEICPLRARCAWQRAGRPSYVGPTVRPQRFTGTDRQVRGRLLDVLRAAPDAVSRTQLDAAWPEPIQRERALTSLLVDGLVHRRPDDRYALPG